MSLLASQPFKGLFVLGSIFFNLTRLPLWIVRSALTRQHPKWSFAQALSVRLARAFIYVSSKVQVNTPLPLTPGAEGTQFALLKARSEDRHKFKGPMLAAAQTVQPADIGAIWYPAPPSPSELASPSSLLVVLHIHGGAYVIGDGRKAYSGYFGTTLLRTTPATHVLCPSYRLSTLPPGPSSNPFPAALQDALTSYLYLLHDVKIPASRIVLSGDSAGANCAIALLRYIGEFGAELSLPHPGAALLWSPWIDPTDVDADFETTHPHAHTDYLNVGFIEWGVAAFAGQDLPLRGPSKLAKNPYVNMELEGFKTETPMWVSVGGAEILFFAGKKWVDGMRGEGNEVALDVQEEACHDVMLVGPLVKMEGEAVKIGKRAGEWLEGLKL